MGWLLLFLVMLCFSLSTSQENLIPGISISGNFTLISSSKIFVLGFFSPGNSGKRFLGIWYITYPKSTTQVVWVANRESPLHSPGVCMLSGDGNLVVLDKTRKVIWSTNASISASAKSNTTATLQDSGNLVLTYGKQTLWESFNFPTDTLVPGMKIGFNKRTSQQWRVTSWAASDDPRPGKFTDGIDPKLPSQLLTWKENVPYWRSGIYIDNGNTSLYGGPDGEFYTIFGKSFRYLFLIYNYHDDEAFFTWGVSDPSMKLITVLKPSGGCIREKNLTCDDREERFTMFEKLKLPDQNIMLYKGSISECESECLQNCSCTAYAYVNGSQYSPGRCFKWFGDLMDLVENHSHGKELCIRVHQQRAYHSNLDDFFKGPLGIVLVLSAAGFRILIFGFVLWKKLYGSFGGSKNGNIGDSSTRGEKNDTELPLFDLKCVLAATNNFSDASKLGEGGFGPVYKGILPENQEVAIKRLSKKSGQGHQEFINEIKLIAKLQHKNLVRLLDPSEQAKLDWEKRFRIIEGIAQGVLYLHKHSRLKIIHRDRKASNVLLDEEMSPRVSDFGMARIFGVNQTEANTNRVVGIYGYMSPEYARYGQFSEKSDVFSFGVLLLEVVSGKKNGVIHCSEDSPTLAQWAWKLWKEGRGIEVVDASMGITCQPQEALKCLQIGFLCVQEAPADQPTMATVTLMLQGNHANTLPTSKEPAFSMHSKDFGSSQISSIFSYNALTISLPTG